MRSAASKRSSVRERERKDETWFDYCDHYRRVERYLFFSLQQNNWKLETTKEFGHTLSCFFRNLRKNFNLNAICRVCAKVIYTVSTTTRQHESTRWLARANTEWHRARFVQGGKDRAARSFFPCWQSCRDGTMTKDAEKKLKGAERNCPRLIDLKLTCLSRRLSGGRQVRREQGRGKKTFTTSAHSKPAGRSSSFPCHCKLPRELSTSQYLR